MFRCDRPATSRNTSVVAIVLSLATFPACAPAKATVSRPLVVRLANFTGGPFGRELAAQWRRTRPDMDVQLMETSSLSNLEALARGEADITIGAADSVYFAYRNSVQTSASRSGSIRAIAALHVIPLHLLVRASIRNISDLRSSSFAVSSGTPVERLVFGALHIHADPTTVRQNAVSPTNGARLVAEGVTEAVLVGSYYPAESVQAAIDRGARLLPLEGNEIDKMRLENRFVRQVTIPANMYSHQPQPIHTIGVDTVFVCRSDLDEAVVHELTKRLFESLGALSQKFLGLRVLDVEQMPATPIPLHEGAARYYRELELLR